MKKYVGKKCAACKHFLWNVEHQNYFCYELICSDYDRFEKYKIEDITTDIKSVFYSREET